MACQLLLVLGCLVTIVCRSQAWSRHRIVIVGVVRLMVYAFPNNRGQAGAIQLWLMRPASPGKLGAAADAVRLLCGRQQTLTAQARTHAAPASSSRRSAASRASTPADRAAPHASGTHVAVVLLVGLLPMPVSLQLALQLASVSLTQADACGSVLLRDPQTRQRIAAMERLLSPGAGLARAREPGGALLRVGGRGGGGTAAAAAGCSVAGSPQLTRRCSAPLHCHPAGLSDAAQCQRLLLFVRMALAVLVPTLLSAWVPLPTTSLPHLPERSAAGEQQQRERPRRRQGLLRRYAAVACSTVSVAASLSCVVGAAVDDGIGSVLGRRASLPHKLLLACTLTATCWLLCMSPVPA